MLLSYAFRNCYSFADRAEVSLVSIPLDGNDGWVRTTRAGRRVTTAMAVMGANGAGKSNVIRIGGQLAWFMRESFGLQPDAVLPFQPHMARLNEPSEFSVAYEDGDGAEWIYDLRIRANRVEFEVLSRKTRALGERPSRVFTREARGNGYAVSQRLGLADSEAVKVRPNVSLISWAGQYGSEMAQQIAKISLATNFDRWGREQATASAQRSAAAYFEKHSAHRDAMRSLMKRWDFGLSDVRLQPLAARPTASGDPGEAEWIPVGIHEAHDKPFELPFWQESSGTQRTFVLLWKLLPVLESGGLTFIDELEADLHPHVIEPILRLFHSNTTNPHGAQLVFTCHSPEVLRSFHRAQVTFVEKVECKSQAYRGDAI